MKFIFQSLTTLCTYYRTGRARVADTKYLLGYLYKFNTYVIKLDEIHYYALSTLCTSVGDLLCEVLAQRQQGVTAGLALEPCHCCTVAVSITQRRRFVYCTGGRAA